MLQPLVVVDAVLLYRGQTYTEVEIQFLQIHHDRRYASGCTTYKRRSENRMLRAAGQMLVPQHARIGVGPENVKSRLVDIPVNFSKELIHAKMLKLLFIDR